MGAKRARRIIEKGANRGIEFDINFTSQFGEENATNLAKKAIEEGADRIVVVGGDGTINEVVNGIAGSEVILGIIPAGVGNDFARALGIPEDTEIALNTVIEGKVIEVDLGQANNRYFTAVISFGFDAHVNRRAVELKRKFWFLPSQSMYAFALLRELLSRLEYSQVELDIQGTSLESKVILIAVANTPSYGRIFKIAPLADMRDGRLDVCLIREAGKLRVLKNILQVIQGTHTNLPEVKMFRASSLTIRSLQNLPCQMDGEILPSDREYQISTFPGALKVLVP